MSLLDRHLEQISLSSESIATLPFPPPKIFTNALLATPDITSLIRDTEPHERALFSVPPPQAAPTAHAPYPPPQPAKQRRQTVFNVAAGEVTTGNTSSLSRGTAGAGGGGGAPRRNTAVAAVLGPELHSEVRRTEGGEMDIEVLLRGAEKLNAVYAIAGVPARIEGIRQRYGQVMGSVRFYEQKVAKQTRELEKMNRGEEGDEEGDDDGDVFGDEDEVMGGGRAEHEVEVTDEDLEREEEEIRELERKKKELEDRVRGMERDLGGLLR